jgi:glycosyltransferase involved in cell wall biosynthesis
LEVEEEVWAVLEFDPVIYPLLTMTMLCPTLTELPPPPGRTGWPWTEESPQLPDTMLDGSSWPRASIVTPSCNQGRFIEEAILCVKNQDYPNIEHIIIDGGSTDETLDVIQRYEGTYKMRWVSEPDEGQADALNKGFKLVRGEVLGWLNADDTYQPGAVGSAVAWLQSHPAVDLVYGGFNFISEGGETLYTHIPPKFSLEKLLYGDIIPQAAMFFRRRMIEEIGGVDLNLHYVMDWEFVLRIARHYRVQRVPAVWGNFRITRGTKSVEEPQHCWPEVIPVLQSAIEAEPVRLGPWADDALLVAYLLAALEFARVGQKEKVQDYIRRAFAVGAHHRRHLASLVPIIVGVATRPWHRGFAVHPEAQKTLDGFSTCLGETPAERQLLGYLSLSRGIEAGKQGEFSTAKDLIKMGLHLIELTDLIQWQPFGMLSAAVLGTRCIAKLHMLKNRFIIGLSIWHK